MRPFLWKSWHMMYFCNWNAPVAKLVYAPDLGSGVARRVGSSPIRRTAFQLLPSWQWSKGEFCFFIPAAAGDCTRNRVRLSADNTKYAVAPKRKSRRNESSLSSLRKNKRTFSRNVPTLPTNLWTFSFYSPCFSLFRVRALAPQSFPRITFPLHPTR